MSLSSFNGMLDKILLQPRSLKARLFLDQVAQLARLAYPPTDRIAPILTPQVGLSKLPSGAVLLSILQQVYNPLTKYRHHLEAVPGVTGQDNERVFCTWNKIDAVFGVIGIGKPAKLLVHERPICHPGKGFS